MNKRGEKRYLVFSIATLLVILSIILIILSLTYLIEKPMLSPEEGSIMAAPTISFTDPTPPDGYIISSPNNLIINASVSGENFNSAWIHVNVTLIGGENFVFDEILNCYGTNPYTCSISGDSDSLDGLYIYQILANDTSGNIGSSSIRSFTIDQDIPACTTITQCTIINKSGDYCLANDIDGSSVLYLGSCILINASNVNLYGMGYKITGNDLLTGEAGIMIGYWVDPVYLVNFTGIENISVSGVIIQNFIVGIGAFSSKNINITKNKVYYNAYGIFISSFGTSGTAKNIIKENIIYDSLIAGVELVNGGEGILIDNNKLNNNKRVAIDVNWGKDIAITNNIINSKNFTGSRAIRAYRPLELDNTNALIIKNNTAYCGNSYLYDFYCDENTKFFNISFEESNQNTFSSSKVSWCFMTNGSLWPVPGIHYTECINCVPNCAGKTCGDDSCGGTCSPGCPSDKTCNDNGSCSCPSGQTLCDGICKTNCGGNPPGPPGPSGPSGPSGTPSGCTPNCIGKQCGNDSCGGVCGTCSEGFECNSNNQCQKILTRLNEETLQNQTPGDIQQATKKKSSSWIILIILIIRSIIVAGSIVVWDNYYNKGDFLKKIMQNIK